jgi:hypothetical protein
VRRTSSIIIAGLLVAGTTRAQTGAVPTVLKPFLARNCAGCHNRALPAANLDLSEVPTNPAVLGKLLDKISTGRMPPPGAPAVAKADRDAVTSALEKALGFGEANPGRVTAHRLNRVEYNNSIRELLGLDLHAADEFPLDDAGYGFDNIGDVLSVSPLLMEKYTAAARRIARIAIQGEPVPPKPSKLARFLGKKLQDDPTANALPFSYRGALWATYNFPVEADYEFRMRVANYRPRDHSTPRQIELARKKSLTDAEKAEFTELNRIADPAVKMVMTVDGNPVYSEIVEGNIDYVYAHGESVARVHLTAGEHGFRASFPEYADMANPRDNVNLDGRRKIFVDYFDIVGPFDPKPSGKNARVFVCAERTPACSRKIVENFARRAWRRTPTAAETDELAGLATLVRTDSESFDDGIRAAIQAILMSPNFLFRVERDPTGPLSAPSLASRLSFFLWSAPPDEELLRAAEAGAFAKPDGLHAQVRRMLADPRSDQLVENFAGQWLGLRILDKRKPDPAHFPVVDDELLDAMRRESELFARAILRENRSITDFLDGKFAYLNGPLARYYGIPGVSGEAFQRVNLPGDQRGGVLGQGAILALSSYATRTSPVLRGKWVLENLLGTPPPPPPPDVPALKEDHLGTEASVRQRLEQHRARPECAVCHNMMDPIGFALEHYDASGAWRDKEGNFPVDASGQLPGGKPFNGPAGLKQALREQSEPFIRNFTEKMLTYALGRGLEPYDRSTVDHIVARLAADNYRFSTLITEIIDSQPFRMR